MNTARARLLIVLALVAATLALFGLTERYQLVKAQILQNGDFSTGLEGWQVANKGREIKLEHGIVHIRSIDGGQSPNIRQRIQRAAGVKHVRLSAWVRHRDVTIGLRPWNAMRLLLVQKDANGDNIGDLPHVVQQSRGSSPWRRISKVFWLPPRVGSVEVIAMLSRVAGEMSVRDLRLDVVQQRQTFSVLRYGLIATWLLLLPWLAWPLFRGGRRRYGRLGVAAVALIILFGALTPHIAKNEIRRFVKDIRQSELMISLKAPQKTAAKPAAPIAASKASSSTSKDTGIPISAIWLATHKLGHLGLFALLALAAALTWRRQSWQRLGMYLFAFAITAETLQLLSLDRSAHPLDAGLNVLGAAAGLALGSRLLPRHAAAVRVPGPPNA